MVRARSNFTKQALPLQLGLSSMLPVNPSGRTCFVRKTMPGSIIPILSVPSIKKKSAV